MTDFITHKDLEPYCKGFTKAQLDQAKEICEKYQLTPQKRQIHFSLRNVKQENGTYAKEMTFLVTVDGLRGIAERGGAYQGQVGPFWCGPDGVWKDVWLSDSPPAAAKIGVHKNNFRDALYAVAKFDEYRQKDRAGNTTGMWEKMPATMIAKCAEALALRRAFPDETGGLYTQEEGMQQAESPKAGNAAFVEAAPLETPKPMGAAKALRLEAIARIKAQADITEAQLLVEEYALAYADAARAEGLTQEQIDAGLASIDAALKQKEEA